MKRLITTFAATAALVLGMAGSAAASTWAGTISQLPATMNTHNFNVQYTVLSTETDSFTAQLKVLAPGSEGYLPCGSTQDTDVDANDFNGGNGTLNVAACVPTDGNYSFEVVITRDGTGGSDQQTVGPTSTRVDTTAPGAPIYHGKVQSGNTYTLSFTAPSDSDVSNVQIFVSTSKTYTAGPSTFVGKVGVTPNGNYTFAYTAPNSTPRYFALQAFDVAGNGSTIVGDPGAIVHPVVFVNNGAGSSVVTASATGSGASSSNGSSSNGSNGSNSSSQVGATGPSSTTKSNQKNGTVLGTDTVTHHHNTVWYIVGGVAIVLLALYYWFFSRLGKSWFTRP